MKKYSLNINIPFAVACQPIINQLNGNKYNKKITVEYKELQAFCKSQMLYLADGKGGVSNTMMRGEPMNLTNAISNVYYKNIWININPDYVKCNTLSQLNDLIYQAYRSQTPADYDWESSF